MRTDLTSRGDRQDFEEGRTVHVVSFDRDAAAAYGRLRATLEQKGMPIGSMDLLIAGHALSLAVRLVTNNARKLRRVPGLRVENWV